MLAVRERYGVQLTVQWIQEEKESGSVGSWHDTIRTYDRKITLLARDEKTETVDVFWYKGESLEKALEKIRPREKWNELKDNVNRLYYKAQYGTTPETPAAEVSASLSELQQEIEGRREKAGRVVSLVLKAKDLEIYTYYTSEGTKHVYVDDEEVGYFDRRLWPKWIGGKKACESARSVEEMLTTLRVCYI
jgi:hypothetical protein